MQRPFYQNNFSKKNSLKRRKKSIVFIACLCLYLLQFNPVKSQVTTDTSYTDSLAENNNNNNEFNEDDDDTTGYYFNWKEYVTDAYTKEKLDVRASSDTTIQRLRNDDDFWYVKSIEDFKKQRSRIVYDKKYRDSLTKEGLLPPDEQVFTHEPNSNEWFNQRWVSLTIWAIIIVIFISAVVYFLLSDKISLFTKKAISESDDEIDPEENLSAVNYDRLLAKYTEEKNYRLAVRVLYLQLLKRLSDDGLILFQPQLTNTHYLRQLYQSPLYNIFFTVTRHYEHVWYGEFSITEPVFEKIKSDFANITNQVSGK